MLGATEEELAWPAGRGPFQYVCARMYIFVLVILYHDTIYPFKSIVDARSPGQLPL